MGYYFITRPRTPNLGLGVKASNESEAIFNALGYLFQVEIDTDIDTLKVERIRNFTPLFSTDQEAKDRLDTGIPWYFTRAEVRLR